jgi:hypothetical protein
MPDTPPCCAEVEEPPCPQHAQAAKVLRHNGIRLHAGRAATAIGESGKAKPAKPEEAP